MNAIKELRNTTNMSQSSFAAYLGIPVANVQRWEQGVSNPPAYVISLISRVMRYDGYIQNELTSAKVDALRQTQATLSLERLSLTESGINEITRMIKGEISREDYQRELNERYQRHEAI